MCSPETEQSIIYFFVLCRHESPFLSEPLVMSLFDFEKPHDPSRPVGFLPVGLQVVTAQPLPGLHFSLCLLFSAIHIVPLWSLSCKRNSDSSQAVVLQLMEGVASPPPSEVIVSTSTEGSARHEEARGWQTAVMQFSSLNVSSPGCLWTLPSVWVFLSPWCVQLYLDLALGS